MAIDLRTVIAMSQALKPVAVLAFGSEADLVIEELVLNLNARAAKAGITL